MDLDIYWSSFQRLDGRELNSAKVGVPTLRSNSDSIGYKRFLLIRYSTEDYFI